MKTYFSFIFACFLMQFSVAQEKNDILLTIDGHPITTEEFLRIYNKNSSIADEQKKSVDEYLDLFINYKLKVIEAENLGYDTMSSFIKEMSGYTKQLAKPYLENSAAYDSFAYEAYQRSLEEVNVSHIMLPLDRNALPRDTVKVYDKIMGIWKQLDSGEPWDKVIKDNSSNQKDEIGGDLGWFTVFRMVYAFETAAYNTPVGHISKPFRTEYGYHIIRVNGRRPSRGDVLASHIMTYVPRNPTDVEIAAAEQKIQKAYSELQQGVPWNNVVRKYSEHKATIGYDGSLGWIKAGSGPDTLVDMAFSLDSGQYSKPFRSQYGFHIVMNRGIKPVPSWDEVKDEYIKKVKQTGDIMSLTRDQTLNRIKKECGFKFFESSLNAIYALADTNMRMGTWNPDKAKGLNEPVMIIGYKTYTQYDIAKAVCTQRFGNRSMSIPVAIRKRLMNYIDDELDNYEMNQLPKRYPDYKNLLEEYHDGILLFNLTEDKVWKKAVDDSTGLQRFYDSLPVKYEWGTRLALTKYTYKDSTLTDLLINLARKRAKAGTNAEELSKKLCPDDSVPCVSFVELKYERGDNSVADSMEWKKGSHLVSKDKDNTVLYYVDAVLPKQLKTLKDARGLYTADYQSYLEKKWIQELRKKYTIKINEDVLAEVRSEENKKQ
jgi:peptidyl-prolyl cis-trans isomerase SurA